MKHAGEESLNLLENLLQKIRKHQMLKEKKRGTFYRKSSAFLHFHEDPSGLFADVRVGESWERFPVTTKEQQATLLGIIDLGLNNNFTDR